MKKPAAESLQPLIEQGRGAKSEEQWRDDFVKKLAAFIEKDPRSYRGFGPYWWLLKKAMIDRGMVNFGAEIDAETFEAFDYGNESLNLAAAFAYYEVQFELGNRYAEQHALEDDDGEPVEYFVTDEEVEMLATLR